MPRQPDPLLEERILCAAQKLWKKGGGKALTMRAVARAAGTNTPAVYRRFRNREEILRALLKRLQREISTVVGSCRSPEEACEQYLEFALRHPHEYELFYEHSHQLHQPRQPGRVVPLREQRPTMALMEAKLAERLGGSPPDHTRVSLALWAVTHGTAMILISKSVPAEHAEAVRLAFRAAVENTIRNASYFSTR